MTSIASLSGSVIQMKCVFRQPEGLTVYTATKTAHRNDVVHAHSYTNMHARMYTPQQCTIRHEPKTACLFKNSTKHKQKKNLNINNTKLYIPHFPISHRDLYICTFTASDWLCPELKASHADQCWTQPVRQQS